MSESRGAHAGPGDGVALERPSPAEHARTVVASTNSATLASLTADGAPWASMVAYGLLSDGSPVVCVSDMALHARNLAAEPRASIAVAAPAPLGADPADSPRLTLAGRVERPVGAEDAAAKAAFRAAVPSASVFEDFDDFTRWVLRIESVRWVGGFARMAWVEPDDYRVAAPDPVAPASTPAITHLNADHAAALLAMARALGGRPDATTAECMAADRYGLDLRAETPEGLRPARVEFAEPIDAADELRAATVELARRARASARNLGG